MVNRTDLTGRLRNAAREIVRVPVRFPVPLACAVLWTFIIVAEGRLFPDSHDMQLLGWLPLALFATLAVKLAAESRGWRVWVWVPASIVAFALVMLHTWVARGGSLNVATPNWLLLAPAAVLAALVAPFLRRGVDDDAAWQFAAVALWRAFLAVCVALVAALGLSALQAGVETLFWDPSWPVKRKISTAIWAGSFGLGAAWMALAGIPRRFDVLPKGDPPTVLRWVVAGLLVPLALAYLGLIYAFAVKTMFLGELPKGTIGWMVAGFAAFGVSVWTIAWPWRESGHRLVRLGWRWFPPTLLVPVVLLALAVHIRVSDYGVTEQRYGLIVLAVWLAALALFGGISRPPRLVAAPAMLACLLLLASYGPWGAGPVSARSQLAELTALLAEHDALPGRAVPATDVDRKRRERIEHRVNSIAAYFSPRPRRKLYEAWLERNGMAGDGTERPPMLMTAEWFFGEEDVAERHFQLRASDFEYRDISVKGFDAMYRFDRFDRYQRPGTPADPDPPRLFGPDNEFAYNREGPALKVWRTDAPDRPLSFDLTTLGGGLKPGKQSPPRRQMTLEMQNAALRVRLTVEDMQGQLFRDERPPQIDSVEGFILAASVAR